MEKACPGCRAGKHTKCRAKDCQCAECKRQTAAGEAPHDTEPESEGKMALSRIMAAADALGNPYHEPAGSPKGGQFTSGGSGRSSVGSVGSVFTAGNIDLSKQIPVKNKDGSVSTVRSITIGEDGRSVLIPTVVNGKIVSNGEAIAEYRKTGRHLGKYATAAEAQDAARELHDREAARVKKLVT